MLMQSRHEQLVSFSCLFLFCIAHVLTATTGKAIYSASPQSTCRPVNYILDSLPQQCPLSLNPSGKDLYQPISQTTLSSSTFREPATNGRTTTLSQNEHAEPIPGSAQHERLIVPAGGETASVVVVMPIETEVATPISLSSINEAHSNEGFLSFEDWKNLNLLRSAEVVANEGQSEAITNVREAPQPRGQHGDQAIDSIGDEIDLQIASTHYGRTSKERFNYASFDCAAAVLKANPEAKGSSSILDENQDRYMLNKCSAANKFVIVEMCEDILVDTIVLANLEFFSSTFRDFRVSVSDRFPIPEREWKTLGTFAASNSRTLQVFAIKNPLIWTRYLRIEFLTHFGNEFYCPLTLLRVHGTTMMEEYKNQENAGQEKSRQKSAEGSSLDSRQAATTNVDYTQSLVSSLTVESVIPEVTEHVGVSRNIAHISPESTSVEIERSETTPKRFSSRSDISGLTEISKNEEHRTINSTFDEDEDPKGTITSKVVTSSTTSTSAPQEEPSQQNTTSTSELASSIDNTPEKESSISTSSVIPTTQESVYKTITKRLSLLEANATLSLRYIEEQSQLMRDVFSKMERRHAQKIDIFISELNNTLATRLSFFHQQYEQLWQSTIVELETQREISQAELVAMSARLSLLADEMIFQKRMSIAHSVMLLITLLFVLTTRGVTLDLSHARRVTATRAATTTLTTSPRLGRHHYRSHSTHNSATEDYISTQTPSLAQKPGRGRKVVILQQARSAPASPAGTLRGWNMLQKHHEKASDTLEEVTTDTSNEGSSDRPSKEENLEELDAEGGMASFSDYPSPVSAIEQRSWRFNAGEE